MEDERDLAELGRVAVSTPLRGEGNALVLQDARPPCPAVSADAPDAGIRLPTDDEVVARLSDLPEESVVVVATIEDEDRALRETGEIGSLEHGDVVDTPRRHVEDRGNLVTEVEKEKEVWREQLKKEGKPEAIWDKIMMGKEKKFREEHALLTQPFAKDPSVKVEQYLKGAKVTAYVRLSVGE